MTTPRDYDAEVAATRWMRDGNCVDISPAPFFPTRGTTTREAVAICAGCLVREECLEYALDTHQHYGIWGGTSERERRRIRKERAAAQAVATTPGDAA